MLHVGLRTVLDKKIVGMLIDFSRTWSVLSSPARCSIEAYSCSHMLSTLKLAPLNYQKVSLNLLSHFIDWYYMSSVASNVGVMVLGFVTSMAVSSWSWSWSELMVMDLWLWLSMTQWDNFFLDSVRSLHYVICSFITYAWLKYYVMIYILGMCTMSVVIC